ncbi:MAG: hypothetical protein ACI909_003850 [Planctomycetota bacterium]|jgi:hypothetical protein
MNLNSIKSTAKKFVRKLGWKGLVALIVIKIVKWAIVIAVAKEVL